MSKVQDDSFDLRALVRQVIDQGGLSGPHDVADKVAGMTPEKVMSQAYRIALTEYVRHVIDIDRMQNTGAVRALLREASNLPAGTKNSARSGMQKRIRAQWQRMLASDVHVGRKLWKPLGQCSYDEVMYLAEERAQLAAATAAVGRMYGRLAQSMLDLDAERVADLPESMLADILIAEAAA